MEDTHDADAASAGSSPALPTALRMLSRRALSAAELQQKLLRRGFDSAAVSTAIAAVARYGYINDQALAQGLADSAPRRGRGPLWVRNTARRRGITENIAEAAAEASYGSTADAVTTARELLARRFKSGLAAAAERQRAYRFLLSRGFSPACVRAAVGAHDHPSWSPEIPETEDAP